MSKRCPVCNTRRYANFQVNAGYLLVKCLACSMIWDPKPPTNPAKLYQADYFTNDNSKGGYSNYYCGMKLNSKTFFLRYKEVVKRKGKNIRLLDVGCAFGDSLIQAKRLGIRQIEGIDISEFAVKIARQRGLDVQRGTMREKLINGSSSLYDVITLQDVIEHIANPLDELKTVYQLLKPGGLLFVVTPDIGGFWSKVLGRKWYHLKPKEHVVYFSKNTITNALVKTGFTKIEVKSAFSVMTLDYMFNRLKCYSPAFFGFLEGLINITPLKDLIFQVNTGEIEVWAIKPVNH